MTRVAPFVLFVLATLAASSATAQPIWDDDWRTLGATDLALTSAFGVVMGGALLVGPPDAARWSSAVLLDLPLRRAIGARQTKTEVAFAHTSDGLVVGLLAMPFVEVALASYDKRDVRFAQNFSGIALQSVLLNFATTNLVKVIAARARPDRASCFENDTPCEWREPVSFFSGHSSGAFTGAGLVCAMQSTAQVHEGWARWVPCGSALTLAATTALMRVVANKHHLSDVVVGAVVGLASGWLWPTVRLAWEK